MGVLELIGIVAFAVSGGLAAVRHGFDLVGVAALSLVTAIGGGIIRDVLLGDHPVAALTDWLYLVVPIATALLVMVFHGAIDRHLRRPVLVFDAAGLGVFVVTGTVKAIDYDITVWGAVLLGVISATGGGVLRDMLCSERPVMFRADSVLYSIPAAGGATAIVMLDALGIDTAWSATAVAASVFTIRILALRFRWRAPSPASVWHDGSR